MLKALLENNDFEKPPRFHRAPNGTGGGGGLYDKGQQPRGKPETYLVLSVAAAGRGGRGLLLSRHLTAEETGVSLTQEAR